MVDEATATHTTVDATVVESSVIDQSLFQKVLRQAGRSLARPALEALEMLLDASTPAQARLTMLAALTYLIMPIDLVPDLIPVAGFSDDLVALTAVVGLWSNHMTPQIRDRARRKLDRWFPVVG